MAPGHHPPECGGQGPRYLQVRQLTARFVSSSSLGQLPSPRPPYKSGNHRLQLAPDSAIISAVNVARKANLRECG